VLSGLLRVLSGRDRDHDIRRKLEPWLRDGNACAILRLILENPGITRDRLARRSGIDKTVADGSQDGLVRDGLVVVDRGGAEGGCHIAGSAKAAVVEHLPLNYQCPGMMR
jgi:hypothetical protein